MAMDDPMMENASNTLSNNKSLNKRTPSVHNSVSNRQNMMEIQHDNNNPIHEGMYEGGQPNYNYKIPQIKGEVIITLNRKQSSAGIVIPFYSLKRNGM